MTWRISMNKEGVKMAQKVTCPRCLFMFWGGHSHYLGASHTICIECLSEFALRTESEWGPHTGERVELVLVHTVERRPGIDGKPRNTRIKHSDPTGIYVTAVRSASTPDQEFESVEYSIGDIACPHCKNDSLQLGFESGDLCPECGNVELRLSNVLY